MQQLKSPSPTIVARNAASGAIQFVSGGYAFGLRVSQTCDFRYSVGHSGGLPGFGSQMSWLPEYGVGIVAFGNLTYTGWSRVMTDAQNALVKIGRLQPRTPKPSAALTEARDAVSRLIVGWDDKVADRIAAENLFLDQSRERRRAELDGFRAQYGACTPGTNFDVVENALRGQWTLQCQRGKLRVTITLAPTMPPRVQLLDVRPEPAEPPRTDACLQ
jgi:hypothetical protein